MPSAFVKFPPTPHYQKAEAFEPGLKACGFTILQSPSPNPSAGDVLVIWNRYIRDEQLARDYERAGGVVLVAENAFLGPDEKGAWFALCRGHHNGAGTWFVGQRTRHEGLFETLRPWRRSGEHIVILPQRGMGEPGVRMELSWPDDVKRRLERITKRPVVIRDHPGARSTWTPERVEMTELEGAWAAVVWASSAGLKALCAGIPVFYEFPKWIGADAGRLGIDNIEAPYLGDGGRGTMLRKVSWAQWSAEEIRTGEPFRCLLSLS